MLVLEGLLPHISDTSLINYFSNPTQKASLARNLGAQGVIFINSENNDTTEKLNYFALNKCPQLFKNIKHNINHDNTNLEYVVQVAPNKSRSRLKSYLGTIPDYGSSDVKGVAISDVTSVGPAEKAGLKSENIVVQLGEDKVKSLYDYTRATGNTIPSKQTFIIIQRGNQGIELKITPTARKKTFI